MICEREVVRFNFADAMTDAIIQLPSTNQGGNEYSWGLISVDADGFNLALDELEDENGPLLTYIRY
jgi:hypothetical protein